MVRILIADDHDVVRSGLRRVLEAQPGWEVVAEAEDGRDAIGKARAAKPDVAVLDCMMPLLNGVEATRQIRARVPETEVLVFTLHEDERLIKEILRAGARGYVLKSDVGGQLINAVQALAEHKPFFTHPWLHQSGRSAWMGLGRRRGHRSGTDLGRYLPPSPPSLLRLRLSLLWAWLLPTRLPALLCRLLQAPLAPSAQSPLRPLPSPSSLVRWWRT